MSETRLLARFAAGTPARRLPGAALDAAGASLADAVAVMLAGSGSGEGCDAFVDVARVSGSGPCAVVGHDFRTSPAMAAFANGAMAHAMDFEDTHDHAIAHPHAAAIPAALAIVDTRPGTAGDDLLAAVAIAGDLVCRIAGSFDVNPDDFGWHTTPWLGVFGAATAAGRLLGLDADRMVDAWSLAMSQMASFGELKNAPNAHVRAVRDAFAAQAGVLGAMLAARGVRGYDEPLQGGAGFLETVARGRYTAARLVEDLGTRLQGAEVSFKPWPCCRGTHAYVDAGLRLAARLRIEPDRIRRIDVVVNQKNRMLCEPRPSKVRPDTAIGAKFSIPFTTATALLDGAVGIASFSPAAVRDERVLALAARVHHTVDPDIPLRDVTRGSVTLHLDDGAVREDVVHALGHPLRPMTPDAFRAKFDDCTRHARRRFDDDRRDRLWDALRGVRSNADVSGLTGLLQG